MWSWAECVSLLCGLQSYGFTVSQLYELLLEVRSVLTVQSLIITYVYILNSSSVFWGIWWQDFFWLFMAIDLCPMPFPCWSCVLQIFYHVICDELLHLAVSWWKVRQKYPGTMVKAEVWDTWYSAAYMRRLVNSSTSQSWKWQLIGMS